jgi:hypothetical protein
MSRDTVHRCPATSFRWGLWSVVPGLPRLKLTAARNVKREAAGRNLLPTDGRGARGQFIQVTHWMFISPPAEAGRAAASSGYSRRCSGSVEVPLEHHGASGRQHRGRV